MNKLESVEILQLRGDRPTEMIFTRKNTYRSYYVRFDDMGYSCDRLLTSLKQYNPIVEIHSNGIGVKYYLSYQHLKENYATYPR